MRIEKPNARPTHNQAGKIIVDAIEEAGIDPVKALKSPLILACLSKWGNMEWTREQFIRACRKILVINPSLERIKFSVTPAARRT